MPYTTKCNENDTFLAQHNVPPLWAQQLLRAQGWLLCVSAHTTISIKANSPYYFTKELLTPERSKPLVAGADLPPLPVGDWFLAQTPTPGVNNHENDLAPKNVYYNM